jgi:hypothetical protein
LNRSHASLNGKSAVNLNSVQVKGMSTTDVLNGGMEAFVLLNVADPGNLSDAKVSLSSRSVERAFICFPHLQEQELELET